MEYELKTNRGFSFTFQSETFIPAEYIKAINEEGLLTVAVGNMVIHKNNIQSIVPIYPEGTVHEGTKLDIFTNQQEVINAYTDTYSANDVSAALNDRSIQFILLGEVIIHKHNANLIMPAAAPTS